MNASPPAPASERIDNRPGVRQAKGMSAAGNEQAFAPLIAAYAPGGTIHRKTTPKLLQPSSR